MNKNPNEIEKCTSPCCAFYAYRMANAKYSQKELTTAIKKKCLDCHADIKKEARECEEFKCPIFSKRYGKSA